MTKVESLIAEYVAFKARDRGAMNLRVMGDRAQAGMWLKIFGTQALREYDAAPLFRVRQRRWPTTRSLLADALRELVEQP